MRSELGERRMNPLSPVISFSHTQCGKISSEKLRKRPSNQARSAIKENNQRRDLLSYFYIVVKYSLINMVHERIDPHLDERVMRLSRLAHIKRYQKALQIIGGGNNVLDAGCGFGYGSKILSDRNTVVGIDISNEAIEYAQANYSGDKIIYHCGDLGTYDLSQHGQFDAITYFEVLEHVDDPSKTLQNIRDSLKDSGKIVISVPNANNAPLNNEHHVNRYTPEDLEQLLNSSGFEVKQQFGQYPLLGAIAEIAKKVTGYNSCTDKESGLIPRVIDSIPGLPNLFSNLYESDLAVSTGRTIYFVAEPIVK